jgi:hypothetical protein
MLDWFKGKKDNVVPFPASQDNNPYVPPPKPESKTFYSIGVTDDQRVSITMGYYTLNMNKEGVQNLIDQLTVFRDQLPDYDE